MATNFKYAGIADLTKYFNRVDDFDSKVQIFPNETSGNNHYFRDCGYVDTLFINGEELAAAQSTVGAVDANNEWFYTSSTNQLQFHNSNYSSTTINEQIFEVGQDFTDFLSQTLVDASLELHNYIDARYSTPLEKTKQIDLDTGTGAAFAEYDPIIIKSVCYISAANLIRAKEGISEEADYFMSLVTNPERTGLIDKLNDGIYKLSHEVDANDNTGKINARVSSNGDMDLIQLYGEYSGEKYDKLKVRISTSGDVGVAKYIVDYFGDNKLLGASTSAEIITGGVQHLHGGLFGRFIGSSANTSDYWTIEVYSNLKQTNKSNATIEMVR